MILINHSNLLALIAQHRSLPVASRSAVEESHRLGFRKSMPLVGIYTESWCSFSSQFCANAAQNRS